MEKTQFKYKDDFRRLYLTYENGSTGRVLLTYPAVDDFMRGLVVSLDDIVLVERFFADGGEAVEWLRKYRELGIIKGWTITPTPATSRVWVQADLTEADPPAH